jgi:menaquinone-specific isochorismate synthase
MTVLPLDPAAHSNPAALREFLEECRAAAAQARAARLVSISLEVDALDPLAVLESIFDPNERHFYVERLSEPMAVAGAETALAFASAGPGRFDACRRFIDKTLAEAIAIGSVESPFGGPHFFCSFSFLDEVEPGEAFEAASVFVPRWQVGHRGGRTTAVANVWIESDSPVDRIAERIWRAHAKFHAFDYAEPEFAAPAPASVSDVGEPGRYEQAVRRAVDAIGRGEFEKIVLARAKDILAVRPLHPLRVLNGLRQRYPDCYAFSLANGRGQSLIGASPELLARVGDCRLETEALAGSARRGASASEDAALAAGLLKSDKELREHHLVVEAIVQRLEALGLSARHLAAPGLRRFANVQHLHTPIKAMLPKDCATLDLVARLHPTPAVGGSPRESATSRIREMEGFPRGLYAAPIGWVDPNGGGEFFVGLRSALIDGPRARLYAGAGIVAGSSPSREFAETELKFRAMEEALLS